jgi:hypothetical protein
MSKRNPFHRPARFSSVAKTALNTSPLKVITSTEETESEKFGDILPQIRGIEEEWPNQGTARARNPRMDRYLHGMEELLSQSRGRRVFIVHSSLDQIASLKSHCSCCGEERSAGLLRAVLVCLPLCSTRIAPTCTEEAIIAWHGE